MKDPSIFIAEVKVMSKFGFTSEYDYSTLLEMAIEHGDMISIHTSGEFGGSMAALRLARKLASENWRSTKSVIAKGFHKTDDEIDECIDNGANFVLVVNRIPHVDLHDFCIIEVSDFDQFLKWSDEYPSLKYLHNRRDIHKSGMLSGHDSFIEWRLARTNVWLCQASGIRSKLDVHDSSDAFIVGSYLSEFCKSK